MHAPAALLAVLLGAHAGFPGGLPPTRPKPPVETEAARMLRHTGSLAPLESRFDIDDWMPRSTASELELQYQDLVRDYEARESYHLTGQDETIRQLGARRSFARYVALRTLAIRGAVELRRLDRRLGRQITAVQRQARGIVGGARRPVEVSSKLPGVQYGATFNLLEQHAKTWVSTALANGSIDYQGVSPPLPLILKKELEVFATGERMLFQLWRPVPLLQDTEARATYGTSSSVLGLSLARSFTEHLRSVYEWIDPLSGARAPEHVIKVQFAVRI